MSMDPDPHWLFRAQLAHDRPATDGSQRDTDRERVDRLHQPEREVAQYRIGYERGYLTRETYEQARERLLNDADAR